jgi:hypothetical protein
MLVARSIEAPNISMTQETMFRVTFCSTIGQIMIMYTCGRLTRLN